MEKLYSYSNFKPLTNSHTHSLTHSTQIYYFLPPEHNKRLRGEDISKEYTPWINDFYLIANNHRGNRGARNLCLEIPGFNKRRQGYLD